MSNPILKNVDYQDLRVTEVDDDSKLRADHEELYGILLIANHKLDNVGTMTIWLMILFVIGSCVTIHMRWIDPLFGIPVDNLRGWGVYVLIAIASFVIYCVFTTLREKLVYRETQPAIANYLTRHRLSIAWLIAQLDGDDQFGAVAKQIKNDTAMATIGVKGS